MAYRVPAAELRFTFVRSSGPGGQNVNKVNSKAVLHWNVAATTSLPAEVKQRFLSRYARRISSEGMLVLASQRFRDQARNEADCVVRLEEMIAAVAKAPKPRRPTQPTAGSRRRRLEEKRAQSARKQLRRRPEAD
jgi:ribosome-associated protein